MKAAVLTHYDKRGKADRYFDFLFVHEDGQKLDKIGSLFDRDHPLTASIDGVFSLDQVNEALAKVAHGGSKGKTILKI